MEDSILNELGITLEVAEKLDYYVYLYVDPRTNKPFYVGKGKGSRALSHMSDQRASEKRRVIDELAKLNSKPRIEILSHGIKAEKEALRVEAAVIDLLGLDNLTNLVSGSDSVQFGRKTLDEIKFYYAAKPVTIVHPVLLLGINKLYRHGMTAEELYDATRGTWVLDKKRRDKVRFVLAVYKGIIREIYEVDGWHAAGTTEYKSSVHKELGKSAGQCEFSGRVAPPEIRDMYFGGSVRPILPKSGQWTKLYKNI